MRNDNLPNAAVIACMCGRDHQLFGVRFEEKPWGWECSWAFRLKESTAQREGYNRASINSRSIVASPEYPGCPYCESRGFIVCSCGRLTCWNGYSRSGTCGFCGTSGELGEDNGVSLASQEDA